MASAKTSPVPPTFQSSSNTSDNSESQYHILGLCQKVPHRMFFIKFSSPNDKREGHLVEQKLIIEQKMGDQE